MQNLLNERGDGSNPTGRLLKRMRAASEALAQNRNHEVALRDLWDAVVEVIPDAAGQRMHK